MSELTFEQMLEESLKTIHTGEVVEGTVIDVKPDQIILNIDYKSDGILPKSEYTNDSTLDLTTQVKVGDKLDVKVLKVNDGEGQVALTYKRLVADRGSKRIEEAFNNQEVLTAKVAQLLNGGLSVVVDEVRIFIPASLVSHPALMATLVLAIAAVAGTPPKNGIIIFPMPCAINSLSALSSSFFIFPAEAPQSRLSIMPRAAMEKAGTKRSWN